MNVTAYRTLSNYNSLSNTEKTAYQTLNITAYQTLNITAYQTLNKTAYQTLNKTAYQTLNKTAYQTLNKRVYQTLNKTAYHIPVLIKYQTHSIWNQDIYNTAHFKPIVCIQSYSVVIVCIPTWLTVRNIQYH